MEQLSGLMLQTEATSGRLTDAGKQAIRESLAQADGGDSVVVDIALDGGASASQAQAVYEFDGGAIFLVNFSYCTVPVDVGPAS